MAAAPMILLVDDSRFYLEIEKGFLRRTEAELLTARNGVEALELIRVQSPDLVYMEQDLPRMDGAACCRQMKNDAGMKKIPVIMIHDLTNIKGAGLCRESGCNAVLQKPLQRASFLALGNQFLALVERRDNRVPCQQLVIVRQGDECYCGTSVDLSEGGMYVGLDQPIRQTEAVSLSFVMPDSSSALVEATGRVAWTNQGPNRLKPTLPVGFSVEFKSFSADGIDLIRNFVEKKLASPGACCSREPGSMVMN